MNVLKKSFLISTALLFWGYGVGAMEDFPDKKKMQSLLPSSKDKDSIVRYTLMLEEQLLNFPHMISFKVQNYINKRYPKSHVSIFE